MHALVTTIEEKEAKMNSLQRDDDLFLDYFVKDSYAMLASIFNCNPILKCDRLLFV